MTYPCSFMLVAAMNPCPCGYLSDPKHACQCTHLQLRRYKSKISGPLVDRIDIQIDVPAVPYKDLADITPAESSTDIQTRVHAARKIQHQRFARARIFCNAQMRSRQILEVSTDRLGLSARAYNRILKIARTIADLEGMTDIGNNHIMEAIQLRTLDRVKASPEPYFAAAETHF